MGNITKFYHHFDKTQKTCVKNQCRCNNGEPNEDKCEFQGLSNCKSCDSGFHLEKDKYLSFVLNRPIRNCLQNICECENGEASNFLNRPKKDDEIFGCPEHGSNHCAKCDVGFDLKSDFSCEKKPVCSCKNGKRSVGEDCKVSGESCSSCNSGFKKVGGKCIKIQKTRPKESKLVTKLKNKMKLKNEDSDMKIANDFSIPNN